MFTILHTRARHRNASLQAQATMQPIPFPFLRPNSNPLSSHNALHIQGLFFRAHASEHCGTHPFTRLICQHFFHASYLNLLQLHTREIRMHSTSDGLYLPCKEAFERRRKVMCTYVETSQCRFCISGIRVHVCVQLQAVCVQFDEIVQQGTRPLYEDFLVHTALLVDVVV